MVAMKQQCDARDRVGKFEFTVACAEYNPATQRRWDRRVEVLTDWLLSEWKREQKEANRA